MHGCLCEWERGTWHSSCPTCRGSTDSWAWGGGHPSPSSSAHLHVSTDLPPPLTPSPSRAFLPRPLFIPCCSIHIGPVFCRRSLVFPTLFLYFSLSTHLFVCSVSALFQSSLLHILIRWFFFKPNCFLRHYTQGSIADWLEVLTRLLFPCLSARRATTV